MGSAAESLHLGKTPERLPLGHGNSGASAQLADCLPRLILSRSQGSLLYIAHAGHIPPSRDALCLSSSGSSRKRCGDCGESPGDG